MGGETMRRIIILLITATAFLFLLGPANVLSDNSHESPMEIHCKHFIQGYPLGSPYSNDLIIRDLYALSNNDDTKDKRSNYGIAGYKRLYWGK